jgi:plastocyanin
MKPALMMWAPTVMAAVIVTACGGAASEGAGARSERARGGEPSVAVANIAFDPAALEVSRGATVVWASEDEGVRHTVTSGIPAKPGIPGSNRGLDARPDGVFAGDLADAGATFEFTFADAGEYAYFCEIHPSMVARIIVD